MAEGNAFRKETFLDLVKLRSQAKKRKQTHRDQDRNMGGGAGRESAYLETLHTQIGKSPVPFPKRNSLPPTPTTNHQRLMSQSGHLGSTLICRGSTGYTFTCAVKSGICLTSKAKSPQRIKTYIHLNSVQRQIKQLPNPVCPG